MNSVNGDVIDWMLWCLVMREGRRDIARENRIEVFFYKSWPGHRIFVFSHEKSALDEFLHQNFRLGKTRPSQIRTRGWNWYFQEDASGRRLNGRCHRDGNSLWCSSNRGGRHRAGCWSFRFIKGQPIATRIGRILLASTHQIMLGSGWDALSDHAPARGPFPFTRNPMYATITPRPNKKNRRCKKEKKEWSDMPEAWNDLFLPRPRDLAVRDPLQLLWTHSQEGPACDPDLHSFLFNNYQITLDTKPIIPDLRLHSGQRLKECNTPGRPLLSACMDVCMQCKVRHDHPRTSDLRDLESTDHPNGNIKHISCSNWYILS